MNKSFHAVRDVATSRRILYPKVWDIYPKAWDVHPKAWDVHTKAWDVNSLPRETDVPRGGKTAPSYRNEIPIETKRKACHKTFATVYLSFFIKTITFAFDRLQETGHVSSIAERLFGNFA